MPREMMPHLLVLLPGVMGSVLQRDGKDVWAPSAQAVLSELMSGGQSLKRLALDHDDTDDGVVATRLMPDVHLIPGFWKIDGYGKIRDTITAMFDIREDANYYEFPYDWRRDNRIAANRLHQEAGARLQQWRQQSGNPDAKLVLVAHSMGGLIARYFLEVLDGWRDTKALITFGTPYRGSLNALNALSNGIRYGPGGILDVSDIVRSFTAAYQLLPTYPVYDSGDSQLVRVGETSGVPNLDAERASKALAFFHEIRTAVSAHQNDDEYRERGYALHPVVGIEQPTFQSARRSGDRVELLQSYQGEDLGGDGTVPRVSASPEEELSDTKDMYTATKHASLQNADAVLQHLAGKLESLDLNLGGFLVPTVPPQRLSLAIADAYTPDEPVVIRVQPNSPVNTLAARVASATKRAAARRARFLPGADGWYQAEVGPLAPDIYRITVSGGTKVQPVSDIFAVLAPAAS
ncbi:MAG TPA: hypothetical protein VFI42_16945 [Thermomicrobiaceae bacterium]|nr:hypothetical protein [Thermomicrobiaceae bacterium]